MAICAAAVVLSGRWAASPRRPGDHRTQRRIQWVLLGILVAVAVVSLTRQSLAEHYRARAENALAATPSNALKLADRSIRFQREAVPAYYLKAAALARLGRGLQAEHVLREAIRREPDNFLNFALLGDLLVRRGEIARARAAYGKALRLKPRDLQLRNYVRDPRQALQSLSDATGRLASGLGGPIR
jgi:Flp pilus assembly protein TadD